MYVFSLMGQSVNLLADTKIIFRYDFVARLIRYIRSSFRSSLLELFCKKGVLRNFVKFTGKHLCQSLLFNKIAGLRLWHKCFSVKFCKISKNTFSYRTPPVAASLVSAIYGSSQPLKAHFYLKIIYNLICRRMDQVLLFSMSSQNHFVVISFIYTALK